MMEDLAQGKVLGPADPDPAAAERLFRQRQPHVFTYADWKRLDEIETARGKAHGRPRVKFTRVEEMEAALGR
jgi:ferredoxin--NADP+ reductase